jgi:uncharacterized protein
MCVRVQSAKRESNGRAGLGVARRRRILQRLRRETGTIPASALAREFRVSRQCLVQDVAILRASGEEIWATPRGYRVSPPPKSSGHRAVLACRHRPEDTEEELQILVDHGVSVLDVVVEHALYGELRGSLQLESRADVEEFMQRWRSTKATLLSALTRGVHLHHVEARRPELIARAKAQLQARGFLLR